MSDPVIGTVTLLGAVTTGWFVLMLVEGLLGKK